MASRELLPGRGKCRGIKLYLQGIPLKEDFYKLPLEGYEVVLGAQWLRTLGPILWDFSKLQMEFTVGGKMVRL